MTNDSTIPEDPGAEETKDSPQRADPDATVVGVSTPPLVSAPLKTGRLPGGDIPREIPVRLGRYLIEGELGRGAMGIVYKARQEGLDRPVALKILLHAQHASSRMKKRFEREAKAIAKLRHPNIVSVHEVGDFEGQPFFTMDLVDGLPLDLFIKRIEMAPKILADLCRRIAVAADYAHKKGVIHRDLKPSNILVDQRSEPIITDFGLAKEVDNLSMLSVTGDVMGTPAYMAPEQAEGKIDDVGARSDVYSLGAILYAMLVKRDPFKGNTMVETLNKVIHQDPPPVNVIDPRIDADLAAICTKAMEKRPEDRYPSAKKMAEDLENFINGRPVQARQWGWRRKARKFVERNRLLVAASVVCGLLVIIASFLSLEIMGRDYVDLVRTQLTSPQSDVRAQAVASLGKELANPQVLKPENREDAVRLMMDAWDDEDAAVRDALIRTLAEHGETKGLGAMLPDGMGAWLQSVAEDADRPEMAMEALAALGNIRRPEFAQYLIGRLNESNPGVRLQVVRSLGAQRSRDALGPLMHMIVSDPVCRGEAEAALEKFYEKGRLAFFGKHDRLAKNAMQRLQSALSQQQRQREALGLGGSTAAATLSTYRTALAGEDEAAQLQAVFELGRMGTEEAGLILLEQLGQPNSVGEAAAFHLGRSGIPNAVARLPDKLNDDQDAVRKNAALAMGFAQNPRWSDTLLVAASEEKSDGVREAMIMAVGELKQSTAIPSLKNLARNFPEHGAQIEAILQRMEGGG